MRLIRVLGRQLKQARGIATGAGPSSDLLRAVPFTKSADEARAAYDSFHKSFVSYIPSLSPDVKERFLPFWAVSTIATVEIKSAQVGYTRIRTRYDYHNKRSYTYTETDWQIVRFGLFNRPSWDRTHDGKTEIDMQIYASYDYRRADVNGIRGKGCFTGARKLTADMVENPEGGVRGLEEFRMRPIAALQIAKEVVYNTSKSDARDLLMKMYQANDARSIELEVVMGSLVIAPVYVPVYIFESHYIGEIITTFVHGSTLAVGGQRLYYAPLAAIAGGVAAAGIAGFMTGSVSVSTVVMAASIAGVLTLFYPVLVMRFREWWRAREEAKDQWSFFGTWGEDYVNAYGKWEEYARREQRFYEEQQRRFYEEKARQREQYYRSDQQAGQNYYGSRDNYYKQQTSSYGLVDPKGYYKTLGLKPGASEAEIKAAFKALALKHHPDRYQDVEEANKAKARFQKISEAYQVLRDPNKKKMYDQTGSE